MKQSIRELKNIHGNKPVAILGGGPSLIDDIDQLPKDVVLIGVNHHYHRLLNAEYCVFMDKPTKDLKDGLDAMNDTKFITHIKQYSDYVLDVPYWNGGFSSTLATWLGLYITTGNVILCGMDCYQGKPYFYDRKRELTHPVYSYPLSNHYKAWIPIFNLQSCIPYPEKVKAMSGPLVKLFGEYGTKDCKERVERLKGVAIKLLRRNKDVSDKLINEIINE